VETIQRPEDRVGVMRISEIKIELICLPEGRETHRPPRRLTDIGFRHLGFKVDNIHEAYNRLKDKIRFDSPRTSISGRAGRMTVFFADPDGVELHEVQE